MSINNNTSFKETFNKAMKAQGYDCGVRCCALATLSTITQLVLFIIGCIAAAGAFPGGTTVGWVAFGLAGVSYAMQCGLGDPKKRKLDLFTGFLTFAAIATCGVLGGTGVFSSIQVGQAILGTSLANVVLSYCTSSCKAGQIKKMTQNERLRAQDRDLRNRRDFERNDSPYRFSNFEGYRRSY